jgi:hypothetical protein
MTWLPIGGLLILAQIQAKSVRRWIGSSVGEYGGGWEKFQKYTISKIYTMF